MILVVAKINRPEMSISSNLKLLTSLKSLSEYTRYVGSVVTLFIKKNSSSHLLDQKCCKYSCQDEGNGFCIRKVYSVRNIYKATLFLDVI